MAAGRHLNCGQPSGQVGGAMSAEGGCLQRRRRGEGCPPAAAVRVPCGWAAGPAPCRRRHPAGSASWAPAGAALGCRGLLWGRGAAGGLQAPRSRSPPGRVRLSERGDAGGGRAGSPAGRGGGPGPPRAETPPRYPAGLGLRLGRARAEFFLPRPSRREERSCRLK